MSRCILRNLGKADAKNLPDIVITPADKRKVRHYCEITNIFAASQFFAINNS
jgi:hypothetical protein